MTPVDAMKVFLRGFVQFCRVKYLELRVRLREQDEHSILFLTVMIEACPYLQIFRLEVTNYSMRRFLNEECSKDLPDFWRRISQRKPTMEDIRCFRAMDSNFPLPSRHHHNQNFLYQCLETVELVGFSGHPAELELAIYLLENAALRLQRITIDPHLQHFASGFMLAEKVLAARETDVFGNIPFNHPSNTVQSSVTNTFTSSAIENDLFESLGVDIDFIQAEGFLDDILMPGGSGGVLDFGADTSECISEQRVNTAMSIDTLLAQTIKHMLFHFKVGIPAQYAEDAADVLTIHSMKFLLALWENYDICLHRSCSSCGAVVAAVLLSALDLLPPSFSPVHEGMEHWISYDKRVETS
ncbi:hypothetical protein RHGRI_019872 [Rhododendron griersonianum]|uniref:FBD domain-containing protein n=1 Tax=Rhododendron griersonianum TaxID=479676 RepID=A0AAV6JEC3_9ERIC|nr:hypothetical protein RHGRI_019872 [Rhododendron griersonianum]